MFLSRTSPLSLTVRSSLALTWRKASSDKQIAPGCAMPSNRAAILTPSPIRSPSASSTTSPRWMPMRNSMRRSSDTPVTLDHGVLHLNGATHGVDHAAEFDERPVAGALHDAAMIDRDRRIDEIASKRPEPRQRALLVSACESAEPDHIR